MRSIFRLLVTALAFVSLCASAQDSGPARQEFTPKSGNGRVVVVISGQSGMAAYTITAQQVADAGFDIVLVDGNDFWIKDTRSAWKMLKNVITHAQAGSHALPGKVGVVGCSLGGASALS
jgi:dienelactone hydrolase